MVYVLLVLSALVVLVAAACYRAPAGAIAFAVGLCAAVSYLFFSFSARSLMLIYPALLAVWIACRWRGASRRTFAAAAGAAVAAAWGVAMAAFLPRWNEIRRLDAEHPVVRIDERLAYERAARDKPIETDSDGRAEPPDDVLLEATGVSFWWYEERGVALASLERTHDDFVEAFVSQEGFGFIRMRHLPARDEYIRLPSPEPIPIPNVPPVSTSAGEAEAASPVAEIEPFREFHRVQAVEFVNPKGFGHALDGEWDRYGRIGATQVRGFQPHAFRKLSEGSPAGDEWRLARLELVSLLKHDPPAVYLSEHLPRMQDLSSDDAPTRPLDGFESAALARLLDGETLVAERSRNGIRMLGGLRAARQCLQCHSVGEGHLLGAFSYEFRRMVPLPPPKDEPRKPQPVT